MTKKKKDWFDTHVKVMTLDDNPEQEKKIHAEIRRRLKLQATSLPQLKTKIKL